MLQDQFKPAIRIKCQGLLLKGAARLHYMPIHTLPPIPTELEVLKHPPCSSDLAPSYYYLSGPLKDALRGCHFTSDQEVRNVVHVWLTTQPKHFTEGIHKFADRWTKCIEKDRDYIEKLYSL
jgi:hypothetical protein